MTLPNNACSEFNLLLWFQEKNDLYRRLSDVSPYYQYIANHIRDPLNWDRQTVFFMIDGMLCGVPFTSDLQEQKSCYYGPKKDHFIRYTNICNAKGEIVLYLPPTPSISPTQSDMRGTGAFLHLDSELEKQGLPKLTGLVQLIRGSDKWHVNMVADYGFIHKPARLKMTNISKFRCLNCCTKKFRLPIIKNSLIFNDLIFIF